MTPDEINETVRKIADSNLEYPNQVNALIIAMVNLDEERFEKIISTNTLQFGFENTMMNIVYPFLEQIGILWQTGSINPAHEHFITSLIRQKLIVAIDGQISPQNPNAKKYALFLPEGELHEISLLFAAYIIKSRHNRVIYLGQSLPLKDMGLITDVYDPDFVFTIITSYPSKEEIPAYLEELSKKCPKSTIMVTGFQVVGLKKKEKLPPSVEIFMNIPQLIQFVDQRSEQPFMMNSISRSA